MVCLVTLGPTPISARKSMIGANMARSTVNCCIFDSISAALARVEKVELRGFGSFRVRRRNSRRGRNPKTGSTVSVPEKRVPFFKVGKRLKELVNT